MIRQLVIKGLPICTPCSRVPSLILKHSRSFRSTSSVQVGLGLSLHLSSNLQHKSKSQSGTIIVRHSSTSEPTPSSSHATVLASYSAPLSKTFYRLKLFSLGSLTLATALCPALILAPGTIGMAGRIGLCCTALATSGASTALIAWIGKPYAAQMRLLTGPASKEQLARDLPEGDAELSKSALFGNDKPAIQVITTNWRLQKLQTTIYEPGLIRPTSRPFATWELPVTPPCLSLGEEESGAQSVTRLVAATRNAKTDEVIGRWWARWTRDTLTKQGPEWHSDGQCTEEGKVIRHFSVHEDLLDENWQVL